MSDDRRERIAQRYDDLLQLFALQWGEDGHGSVHYGYHEGPDDDAETAMARMSDELADVAGMEPEDRVLDLGCGAGGDAVRLARERGATVVGVDLVASQLERGRRAASEAGVADRVTFQRGDFHEAVEIEGNVDVAWALESLSHSDQPTTVLTAARQALRPTGRMVVADVFLADAAVRAEHRDALEAIAGGMGLQFTTVSELADAFDTAGYCSVAHRDVTEAILPGVDRTQGGSGLLRSLAGAGSKLGLTSPAVSRYLAVRSELADLFEAGALEYRLVRAEAGGQASRD